MDYSTLANMARPQLPPGYDIGGGGTSAGIRYADQNQQYQNFLQQAAGQAQMGMEQQQMQFDEFKAGQPGRLAQQEVKTQEAQQALEYGKSEIGIQTTIAEKVSKLDQAKRKSLESKSHIFAQLAKAKPEQVPEILDYYGDEATYNNKDLRKIPPEKVVILAQGITQGLKETPKYGYGMDLQESRNRSYKESARIRSESNERVAQVRAAAMRAVAKINAMSRKEILEKQVPKSIESYIASQLKAMEDEGVEYGDALEAIKPLADKLMEIRKSSKDTGGGFADLFNRGKEPTTPKTAPAPNAVRKYNPKTGKIE